MSSYQEPDAVDLSFFFSFAVNRFDNLQKFVNLRVWRERIKFSLCANCSTLKSRRRMSHRHIGHVHLLTHYYSISLNEMNRNLHKCYLAHLLPTPYLPTPSSLPPFPLLCIVIYMLRFRITTCVMQQASVLINQYYWISDVRLNQQDGGKMTSLQV